MRSAHSDAGKISSLNVSVAAGSYCSIGSGDSQVTAYEIFLSNRNLGG